MSAIAKKLATKARISHMVILLAITERIKPAQNKSFCPFKAYRHYNMCSIVASSAPQIIQKYFVLGAEQFSAAEFTVMQGESRR